MFVGLITILCVWRLTAIAFTWYFLIGSDHDFSGRLAGKSLDRGLTNRRIITPPWILLNEFCAHDYSQLCRMPMTEKRLELVRGLGAWASAAIVIGTMIGTGHFSEACGNGSRRPYRFRGFRRVDRRRGTVHFWCIVFRRAWRGHSGSWR